MPRTSNNATDDPQRTPPPLGEVHFWWAPVANLAPSSARSTSLLTDEELERYGSYRFELHRKEFLATRILERTVLSSYAPISPGAWRFRRSVHGRPEIAGPLQAPLLRYNLSNTEGLVACVVAAPGIDIGVDVEKMDRRVSLDVADRYFASSELADLYSLPPDAQPRRFYEYWTLKESYIKARGLGLAIPLEQFAFRIDGEGPVRVMFGPHVSDDPSWWEFHQVEPTKPYLAAVAVRRDPQTPIKVVVRSASLALE